MTQNNRQHNRIKKNLTMQYCLTDVFPRKWDMLIIENISVGGVKFIASNDFGLNGKIIQLKIKVPELTPHYLELEAMVLSVKPRFSGKLADVRAKFINVSETDKKDLSILEKFINKHIV